MEIKKVRQQGLMKVITIPKNSKMKLGDFVVVEKISDVNSLFEKAQNGELQIKDLDAHELKQTKEVAQ